MESGKRIARRLAENERVGQPPALGSIPESGSGENVLGDVFDVYGKVIKVHSPVPEMNPDFTMSNYSNVILDNKVSKFVIEQMKVARAISEEIKDKNYAKKAKAFILMDVYMITAMSRARGGAVVNSILNLAQDRGGEVPNRELPPEREPGIMDKLMRRK